MELFVSNGKELQVQDINRFSIDSTSSFTTHDLTGAIDYVNTLHISGETKVDSGTFSTKASILAN